MVPAYEESGFMLPKNENIITPYKWVTKERDGSWREAHKLAAALEIQYQNNERSQLHRLHMNKMDNSWIVEVIKVYGTSRPHRFDKEAWANRIKDHQPGYNYYYFFTVLDENALNWRMWNFDAIGALCAEKELMRVIRTA